MCERNRSHLQEHLILNPLNPPLLKPTDITKKRQRRMGQVVVEYVMLLIIAVAISSLVMKGCVSRNESDAGVIIQFWDQVLKMIGEDFADEP